MECQGWPAARSRSWGAKQDRWSHKTEFDRQLPHTTLSLPESGPRRSSEAQTPPHFCLGVLREGRASSSRVRPQSRTGRASGLTRLEERTLSAKESVSPARREAHGVQPLGLGTEGPSRCRRKHARTATRGTQDSEGSVWGLEHSGQDREESQALTEDTEWRRWGPTNHRLLSHGVPRSRGPAVSSESAGDPCRMWCAQGSAAAARSSDHCAAFAGCRADSQSGSEAKVRLWVRTEVTTPPPITKGALAKPPSHQQGISVRTLWPGSAGKVSGT